MNARASLSLLLLVPACFNPDDSDPMGRDTEASTGSSTSPTTDTPTSGEPTATSTTAAPTTSTTVDPSSTTADPTDDDSTTSSGGSDETTGDPMGRCGNGEAETNEFCYDGYDIVPIGCPATDLAVADLDGNDHLDIAYAAGPDSEVAVYLGSGMGSFIFGSQDAIGGGVSRIALGDFDGAGGPDFAILDGSGSLGTWLNDGNGTVTGAVDSVDDATGLALAVGSLDGDGLSDIVVVGTGVNAVRTALAADGVSPFSANPVPGTGSASRWSVVIAELNGNDNGDIVFGSDNGLFACLGNGSGGVVNCNTTPIGPAPTDIVAGDFDGDGNTDVAVLAAMVGELSVHLGQGNGGFEPPLLIENTMGAQRLVAADFNNDGFDDLAYAVNNPAVAIHLWDPGMQGFGPPNPFPSMAESFSDLAVGDFNEDGLPDIVVGSSAASALFLLLSDA